jgi:hypothetical protein
MHNNLKLKAGKKVQKLEKIFYQYFLYKFNNFFKNKLEKKIYVLL